jgi:drug/metabolite transporter (DMT)-like permease
MGAGDDDTKPATMEVTSTSSPPSLPSPAAPPPSLLRSVLLSYAYVGIWMSLSFSVIVYNKYILDPKLYNWPFPISLTMIHMAFCALLATTLVRVLRVVDVPSSSAPHQQQQAMTPRLYASSVLPIGALYALSLWFSNSAYIYLSVSFIQMLKALMPVAVYSLAVALRTDAFRRASMLNMLAISAGVAVAAYGEARFDAFGVALQLLAVAAEATRLVLIQILLTSRGVALNPITSLYYVAPCCLAFLAVPWYAVELPRLRAAALARPDVFVFATNSLCAFALNLAVFLLVGKTSALTMNVAGVVKDWLLIAFSWTVIKDTVTPVNLAGYGIAFLGVAYYNHAKLQGLKAKEAERKAAANTDDDTEAGTRLLPPDSKDGAGDHKI